jgi:hypothetical protein
MQLHAQDATVCETHIDQGMKFGVAAGATALENL